MNIKEQVLLAPLTTFRLGGRARFFCVVKNEDELVKAVIFAREKNLSFFILGCGSNILVNDEGFDGVVIKIEILGIEILYEKIPRPLGFASGPPPFSKGELSQGFSKSPFEKGGAEHSEAGDFVFVSAGAGEIWDELVEKIVNHGLYGLENLSLIPGTVGAAPVQNIGAYGAEVSKTIYRVRVLDTKDMTFKILTNEQCQFSYRDSIFKKQKGRYIIIRVEFKLSKQGKVDIEYKDVKNYFEKQYAKMAPAGENSLPRSVSERGRAVVPERARLSPSLQEVRKAIVEIRTGKLPDVKKYGNAGSFFKNTTISKEHFNRLKEKYPELPGFADKDGKYKVSLGWILDKICNAKGLVKGKVATYSEQALVIVAEDGATSRDVFEFATKLAEQVKKATDIDIEWEVERV